jgi:hypothetical protein
MKSEAGTCDRKICEHGLIRKYQRYFVGMRRENAVMTACQVARGLVLRFWSAPGLWEQHKAQSHAIVRKPLALHDGSGGSFG